MAESHLPRTTHKARTADQRIDPDNCDRVDQPLVQRFELDKPFPFFYYYYVRLLDKGRTTTYNQRIQPSLVGFHARAEGPSEITRRL